VVRACGAGELAVQDAVRAMAADLPEADVLELLAVAPGEPAERAAYLALIGQDGQRLALDPEGALLALAYRVAGPEVRERLRGVLAAGGDTEVIRVVVTGERRDRVAELSHGELDYLRRHLAEGRRWDELRRLASDLPLAEGAATARLLPEAERTGIAAELASRDPRPTVERLPRTSPLGHRVDSSIRCDASLSPDGTELAFLRLGGPDGPHDRQPAVMRLGTGAVSPRAMARPDDGDYRSVLHLGDRILLRSEPSVSGTTIRSLSGDLVDGRFPVSGMRRSSRGAVMLGFDGLVFADSGAERLRHQPVPALFGTDGLLGRRGIETVSVLHTVVTLPAARLLAFVDADHLYVLDEDGELLHDIATPSLPPSERWRGEAVTFLSPRSLALCQFHGPGGQHVQIWDLPPDGPARLAEEHTGAVRERWPLEAWRGLPIDPVFVQRVHHSDGYGLDAGPVGLTGRHRLITTDGWGDIFVAESPEWRLEVHSPHLPAVRELLERPMLHHSPGDLARVVEARARVGAPDVREALDLLALCLVDRFGGDIALGDGAGPVPPAGPNDIGLSVDGGES
uniref:hypothetical protein n=1 Tax=Streptomyces sp. SBT349 TaxID=1580539 RepID=UPI0018FE9609